MNAEDFKQQLINKLKSNKAELKDDITVKRYAMTMASVSEEKKRDFMTQILIAERAISKLDDSLQLNDTDGTFDKVMAE